MGKRKATDLGLNFNWDDAKMVNALHALTDLRDDILRDRKLKQEAEGGCDEEAFGGGERDPPAELLLKQVISGLERRIEGPTSLSFSDVTFEILNDNLNIKFLGNLVVRGDHEARAQECAARGGDEYMSSKHMYSHLNLLQRVVPTVHEENARLWIDTMFLRVSSMISDENCVALNLENTLPAVGVPWNGGNRLLRLSGTIDLTAWAVPRSAHTCLLLSSAFRVMRDLALTGLFIAKAKQSMQLFDQIPQAIAGMYGAATFLDKDIIRGAISNGHQWFFLILFLNKDGTGGGYRVSPIFQLSYTGEYPGEIRGTAPDVITGILSHWMEHGFDDLDDKDWFQ